MDFKILREDRELHAPFDLFAFKCSHDQSFILRVMCHDLIECSYVAKWHQNLWNFFGCNITQLRTCNLVHLREITATEFTVLVTKAHESGEFTQKHLMWWGNAKVKVKESRKRPGVAQRVPGGLGSQISMTFGTWTWWGRQPHTPAASTPRNVPGTRFH